VLDPGGFFVIVFHGILIGGIGLDSHEVFHLGLKSCPHYLPAEVPKLPELLKLTTFRAGSILSSPVAGFLSRRSCFSFTENFPNPVIRTSSPDASVDFMISINFSTDSVAFF
jgi:hypothetical protein